MFMRKEPFIIPLRREALSTDAFTAKTSPWRKGDVVVIDQVGAHCPDSNNTVVHVGVIRDELAIYYESLDMKENDFYYCTKSPVVIPSGYRIILKFENHAAGDKYFVNIMGHIEVLCKE